MPRREGPWMYTCPEPADLDGRAFLAVGYLVRMLAARRWTAQPDPGAEQLLGRVADAVLEHRRAHAERWWQLTVPELADVVAGFYEDVVKRTYGPQDLEVQLREFTEPMGLPWDEHVKANIVLTRAQIRRAGGPARAAAEAVAFLVGEYGLGSALAWKRARRDVDRLIPFAYGSTPDGTDIRDVLEQVTVIALAPYASLRSRPADSSSSGTAAEQDDAVNTPAGANRL